jgi:hypothetical protein
VDVARGVVENREDLPAQFHTWMGWLEADYSRNALTGAFSPSRRRQERLKQSREVAYDAPKRYLVPENSQQQQAPEIAHCSPSGRAAMPQTTQKPHLRIFTISHDVPLRELLSSDPEYWVPPISLPRAPLPGQTIYSPDLDALTFPY